MFILPARRLARAAVPAGRAVLASIRCFTPSSAAFSTGVEPTEAQGDELVSVPIADIPSGWKGVKRFYDHVGVRPVDEEGNEAMMASAKGYKVLVQGRELRTNGMNDLIVRAPRRCSVWL